MIKKISENLQNTFSTEINKSTYKKKLELLSKFYTKELLPYPNSRSLRSIKTLTEYRGNLVNLKFAEAFELIRIIQ